MTDEAQTGSYQYFTTHPAPRGWFARVLTYHDRAVRTVETHIPEPTTAQKRRRKVAVVDGTIPFAIDGDEAVIDGRIRVPREIRGCVVIGPATPNPRRDEVRIVVRCVCGRCSDIGVRGWRMRIEYGTAGCELCMLNELKRASGLKPDERDEVM